MMFRSSVFALIAATMSFAAEGANITVSATVDSGIDSVALKAGYQSMEVSSDGATWNGWSIGTAYTPTFKGVATGYEGRWAVEKSGQATLSGGEENTITIPTTSYSGCLLRFYSQAKQYAVALDQQGGSGETTSVTATYGAAMPAATMPTRTGYTFGGYYTGPNGGGTQYYTASGESARNWDATSVTKLYAKWTAGAYAVTLDRQSGTGGSSGVTATYGSEMPTITVPTRTGYTFGGYYTGTNGGGTQYYTAAGASAKSWDSTRDTTLYAKWTALTYTVKLDRQSGTGGDRSVTAAYGSAMPTLSTLPARTGYRFGGYYTSPNGGGTQYYQADGTSARNWDKTSATALYAYWASATYTVKLDRQSGSGGPDTVTATYGSAMPEAKMPTRQGYTFGGYWYYSEVNGDGVQYYKADGTSARNWNKTDDATLYAKWTASTYTITLDMLDGSGGSSSVCVKYGLPMLTPIVLPTRTGYTFGGYYTIQGGGGKQYYTASGGSARNWEETSVTKLYAKWTADACKVTLDQQGGSGGTNYVTVAYNSAMPSIAGGLPTRTGYAFGGYYTGENGGGTQYYRADGTSARKWNETSDAKLYAKWTADKGLVTLDQQSGSGGDVSITATYDLALPTITVPTRTGYTFGGYYAEQNGEGTQYYKADGTSARKWDNTDIKTLYAKWTVVEYTVTLDQQDGSGGSTRVTAKYNEALPSVACPTRKGYTFGGYWTDMNGGGKQYYTPSGESANNWNETSDTKLYAMWTAETVTVTLDQQPGTGGSPNVTATYDSALPKITVPTRTGYTFGGYYTGENGGGMQYYDSNGRSARKWDNTGITTLYAKWTVIKYTLTFDKQSGTGGTSSETTTYGSELPTITVPTRTGFTFGGYWTAPDGCGTQYYKADGTGARKWDETDNTTLYAKWTVITYTLTFDRQEGTGGTSSGTATYGSAMPAATMPTRTGYTFGGYYTEPNGRGTQYYDSDGKSANNWDKTDDTTLYAKWTVIEYTLTFDKQSGTGGTSKVTTTYGSELPAITVPTRTGYTFGGYWTASDGGGTQYYAPDGTPKKCDFTSDLACYAKWIPYEYEVAFHQNGADGGGTMANMQLTYDIPTSLAACEFTRTGYAFDKWSSDTNYNSRTKYYADCEVVSNLTTTAGTVVDLYANWTGIVYTVTFDANGGEGTMDPMACSYGVTTNLTACEFTHGDGWGFKEWTNAVGDVFCDKELVTNLTATAGAEVALYACWTSATYAVTFDARDPRGDGVMTNSTGESVSVLTNYVVVGEEWNLPIPTNQVNPHLVFDCWIAPGVTKRLPNDVPPPSAGVTNLVATWKWNPDELAVAVNAPELEFKTFGTTGAYGYPTESEYSASWFAQTDFTHDEKHDEKQAVQSGALPKKSGDNTVYASWLTTKVEGRGVLSFWWKCSAQPLQQESNQQATEGRVGDMLWFFYSDEMLTNKVAELSEVTEWRYVAFTNKSDAAVSFAWAFVYAGGGWSDTANDYYNNGGGTGWVDRVTWTPEKYTVSFNPNGGYGWMDDQTFTNNVASCLSSNAFTNIGHEFLGWATNETDEVVYSDGQEISKQPVPGGTVKLYAVWDLNKYTISFRDGENEVKSITQDYGTAVTPPPNPSRTGCTFAGWAPAVPETVPAENMTCTAQWTTNKYTISFRDGEREVMSITQDYGTAVTAPEDPSRTGHAFDGWTPGVPETVPASNVICTAQWTTNRYTITFDDRGEVVKSITQDYGTAVTAPEDPSWTGHEFVDWTPAVPETVPAENMTCTAQWTTNTYMVEFDVNGGEGAMGDQEFAYDQVSGLTSNALTRVGYTFKGWTNVTDEVFFADGAAVSNLTDVAGGAVKLYAVWELNDYTITFYDRREVVETVTKGYGTAVTAPELSWTGHEFAGWTPAVPETVPAEDMTCTAQWTTNTYTVVFDVNGGEGAMNDQDFTYDQASSLTSNVLTRVGYTFEGWATDAAGEFVYADGAVVSNLTDVAGGTVTLYADWAPDTYMVTFDQQGGAGGSSSVTTTYNATLPTITCPTRTGYRFDGYYTAPNGGGKQYYAPDGTPEKYNFTTNLAFYAKWIPNEYEVEFLPNCTDCDGTMAKQTLTYDRLLRLSPNAFTRPGHVFAGWATNATGEVVYDDGAAVSNLTDVAGETVTLFAKWTALDDGEPDPGPDPVEPELVWTVTFDANDGSDEMSMQSFTNGVEQALASNAFVRVGHAFAGWATNSTGEVVYEDGVSVTLATHAMLYAVWTPDTYTVTLHANGGEGEGSVVVEYGTMVEDIAVPTRAGYTFAGWFTAAEGGDSVHGDVLVTGDMELFAHWTESDEEDTDTPEPENTDPSEPGNTDTPEPGNADPSEPENTDTPEPGNTDTPEPGNADPAEPGNTDTPEQGNTDTPEPGNAQGRTYLWTPVLPDGGNGGDAAFTGEIAESYDGYLQDAAGNVMGTITLKAAKAKGATSKLTVKLQLLAEKKTTVRGRLDIGTGRFEATDSSGRALSLLVGANSLSGSYGSYFIDGGQNKFTTKSAASKAIGTAVLEKWKGVTTVAWRLAGDGSPYHTLSVSVANKGKAKVTGTLADGTKVSAKGQLIVGESWSCIPVTYAKKNARFAFNVWLPNGADATGRVPPVVTGIEGAIVGAPGSLKGGAEFRIDAAALGSVLGKTLLPYLPDGVPVAGGAKWTLPKAGKVVYVKGTATVNEAKAGANPSGLKLTYKAKAGTFKGSFKAYADVGGKPKATTVKVSGVVVDGIGYGAATVRKVGGVPVKIE